MTVPHRTSRPPYRRLGQLHLILHIERQVSPHLTELHHHHRALTVLVALFGDATLLTAITPKRAETVFAGLRPARRRQLQQILDLVLQRARDDGVLPPRPVVVATGATPGKPSKA